MLDRDTATAAAEALTMAIVALFEEGLDAGVQAAKSLDEYSDRARLLGELAEDTMVLTSALRRVVQRGAAGTP